MKSVVIFYILLLLLFFFFPHLNSMITREIGYIENLSIDYVTLFILIVCFLGVFIWIIKIFISFIKICIITSRLDILDELLQYETNRLIGITDGKLHKKYLKMYTQKVIENGNLGTERDFIVFLEQQVNRCFNHFFKKRSLKRKVKYYYLFLSRKYK